MDTGSQSERDESNEAAYVLGIDVGGTDTKVGVFDASGTLMAQHTFASSPVLADGSFGFLSEHFATVLAKAGITASRIVSIGLAVPGPVAADNDFVVCANLDLDVRAYASYVRSDFPEAEIVVLNDADAAAVGDMWAGSASERGCRDFVLLTLGTGIGAGIVLRGELVSSSHGAVGEVGHLCVVFEGGEPCGCGRTGCLEQYASSRALVRMANSLAEERGDEGVVMDVAMTEVVGGRAAPVVSGIGDLTAAVRYPDAKSVFAAARAGDKAALQAVGRFADRLAFGLAQIGCVIDPELIVLGGGMSSSADVFVDAVRTAYRTYAFEACRSTPIVASSLGNGCGIYGAARRALDAREKSLSATVLK